MSMGQRPDETVACRLVGSSRDLRISGCKELFLLEFDSLPGRIAQNHVEPYRAGLPQSRALTGRLRGIRIWELQGPVKEGVGSCKGRSIGTDDHSGTSPSRPSNVSEGPPNSTRGNNPLVPVIRLPQRSKENGGPEVTCLPQGDVFWNGL